MTASLTPPLKWFGGKHKHATPIAKLAPRHTTYVEPYFGGGRVLFKKNPNGVNEIINDIYGELTNFWRTLQQEQTFAEFRRIVEAVPFSQQEFRDAMRTLGQGNDVERAVRFFIVARMSRSGNMKGFTPISKTRGRRGMNEQVSAWLTTIDGLPDIHQRLQRVLILNEDALSVIRKHDSPETWFYLDPPYLHDTRTASNNYEHEMTEFQHEQLLQTLSRISGKFALSGYRSNLYDEAAKNWGWKLTVFPSTVHSGGGKTKRKKDECLWTNY